MRIVAGHLRGRRLAAPPGRETRPTSDRVREALFAIVGPLDGARVLDLFAGSGALGIEAFSRGASSATFVDRDPRAVAVVRRNLEALEVSDAALHRRDALAHLRATNDAYDLIFLDPPYSSAPRLGGPLSAALPDVMSNDALIVTESDKRTPLVLELPLVLERVYGDTRIALHRAR